MEQLLQNTVPMITLGGLIIGYIFKKWFNDVDNKFIPTILAIYGLIANMSLTGYTFEAAIYGALSGLAATGMHQAFVNIIEKKED